MDFGGPFDRRCSGLRCSGWKVTFILYFGSGIQFGDIDLSQISQNLAESCSVMLDLVNVTYYHC
jgi:hypothetical protein